MSRIKLLVENFLAYGLASIVGKIIPLFMLPIVTRLVPTEIFGVNDVLHTISSFIGAFALLGIADAMFRIFFEKEELDFKKTVCTSSLYIVLRSSIVTSLVVALLSGQISQLLFGESKYYLWVIIISIQIALSSIGNIIKVPTRMENKRRIFVLISVLNPLISYSVSIPLIIFVDPLLGLVFGPFTTSLIDMIIFWSLNRKWFTRRFDRQIGKQLLKIGIPLVPTILIYWVFGSFDRIMISNSIGPFYNGIYAAGARIASVSQLIYVAFAGGWQYFVFSTMKDKDHTRMISRVWSFLAMVSFVAWASIYPFVDWLFNFLFEGDYIKGGEVFPYLFLSPLLLMLFQIIGNQFQVIMKTYWSPICLTVGAFINVLLNILLIPVLGVEGAALATLVGYSVSVAIAASVAIKRKILIIERSTLLNIALFSSLVLVTRVLNGEFALVTTLCLLYISAAIVINRRVLLEFARKAKSKMAKHRVQ